MDNIDFDWDDIADDCDLNREYIIANMNMIVNGLMNIQLGEVYFLVFQKIINRI